MIKSLLQKTSLDHIPSHYAVHHPSCFDSQPILFADFFHSCLVILASSHCEHYCVALFGIWVIAILLGAYVELDVEQFFIVSKLVVGLGN